MQIRNIWNLLPLLLALPAALIMATKGFDFSLNEFFDWLLHLYDGYLEDLLLVLKVPEFFQWLQSLLPNLPNLQPHWKHVFVLLWVFFSLYALYSSEDNFARLWFHRVFGGLVAFAFGLAAGTATYFDEWVFLWPIAAVLFFAAGSWVWGVFADGQRPNILSLGLICTLPVALLGAYFLEAQQFSNLNQLAWDLSCNFKSPGLTALVVTALVGAVLLLIFGLPGRGAQSGPLMGTLLGNPGRRLGGALISLFSVVVLVLAVSPWLEEKATGVVDLRPGTGNANIISECTKLGQGAEVCLDMVRIGGTSAFAIGDDIGRRVDSVEVRSFWISRTEVTNAQYYEFVSETHRVHSSSDCRWDSLRDKKFANHPVACITWSDATAYAKWLSKKSGRSYRLPTRAEWQYAAVQYDPKQEMPRFELPWGDDEKAGCEYGNFSSPPCSDGLNAKAPVGSDAWKTTASGLSDMFGNVSEWTEEPRVALGLQDYVSAWYRGICPRVLRGGSLLSYPGGARLAYRLGLTSEGDDVGFRLARTN